MKSLSYLLLTMMALSLTSCLKTREELQADSNPSRPQQQQTMAQQRAAATEAAPAAASAPHREAVHSEEANEQMRALNGRIETLEQAQSENKKMQMEVARQAVKEETDQRFKAYEEELKNLQAKVQALTEIQEQKVAAVETQKKNPKAFYDKGEELFKEKKWKEAISNYQKYREAQPKGPQHPDATYKIGVCFQELNMKDEAKTFYEEVMQKAPKSREAKKAAIRLKSLK